MNTAPCISVVLPTHNGSRYLDQSVASLAAQTFPNWELIIVDDASTDETAEIARDWIRRDTRIRGLFLKENRKLPGALNEGFQAAKGELLTWTSDDNWYHPQALARMREVLLNNPNVAIAYANFVRVDEAGNHLGAGYVAPISEIYRFNVVGACFLYRRQVQDRLQGYDEELFLAEDYDFWLRASNDFEFARIHESLYYYRVHNASLTAQRAARISVATLRTLGKWLPSAKWLDDETRCDAWGYFGLLTLETGLYQEAFEPLLQAQPWPSDVVHAIRDSLTSQALDRARLYYWQRNWSRFAPLGEYLLRHCQDPEMQRMIARSRYPGWIHAIKDKIDRVKLRACRTG